MNKLNRIRQYAPIFLGILMMAALFQTTAAAQTKQTRAKSVKPKVQTASVAITERGYEPGNLTLRRGVPARITFTRQTDRTCATEVVIPAYGINRALPLGEPVVVTFTPRKAGEFTFACGMDMLRGKLIVR